MVQTEGGFGQSEDSVMKNHVVHTEERKDNTDRTEKREDKGMIKSASSASSIGGIIAANTLNEILNAEGLREVDGTPDKAADMSAIKVNNFPFRGITTKDGEKA